jgi:hypothetical protein
MMAIVLHENAWQILGWLGRIFYEQQETIPIMPLTEARRITKKSA